MTIECFDPDTQDWEARAKAFGEVPQVVAHMPGRPRSHCMTATVQS